MANATRFIKMSGSGNDFLFFDGREDARSKAEWVELAKSLCRRGLSVGADGLVVLKPASGEVDFEWLFLNADGSEAEMCGNAGRCAGHVARKIGLVSKDVMRFRTLAGVIQAEITGERVVKVQLTDPLDLKPEVKLALRDDTVTAGYVNTGVPHAVVFTKNVAAIEQDRFNDVGAQIRRHDAFAPKGANANAAEVLGRDEIVIRTFERGVEGETLACGTGCVATAILAAQRGLVASPVRLRTRGGETLLVHFEREGGRFTRCFLEGRVREVYTGTLGPDATLA